MLRCIGLVGLLFCVRITSAQPVPRGDAFTKLPWPEPNDVRTGNGAPGPRYWQQRVDYRIAVSLDTADHRISGRETITYANNSPDTLKVVWLQLDQNLFAEHAPSSIPIRAANVVAAFRGGYDIRELTEHGAKARYSIDGTLMRVELNEPLRPASTTSLELTYEFQVPEDGANRMGRRRFTGGWTYTIGQWYPRAVVYDDLRGWNADPYLGQGEFYLEYGDFDIAVTVPNGFIVAATGVLQNAAEVLTEREQARLLAARSSDSTVAIISRREVGTVSSRPTPLQPTLTWRFRAENVRDVAWAASPAFVWDASGWNGILMQSFYSPDADPDWHHSTDYVRKSIRLYSEKWAPYPYPTAINVAGPTITGGMEYPMIAFNPFDYGDKALQSVTLHEQGHQWFPIMIGSNERRYAWMDEGITTFINNVDDWASGGYPPTDNGDWWVRAARAGKDGIIMTRADSIPAAIEGFVSYTKPSVALYLLRSQVFNDTASFDRALRAYIERWKFKHPAPPDFFRTMEEFASQDLSWFWRGWFYSMDVLDQAVDSVRSSPLQTRGILNAIYLSNRRGLIMPVRMRLTFADGSRRSVLLSADVWREGRRHRHDVESPTPVVEVEVDSEHNFPDVDRTNNRWSRRARPR